MSETPAPSEQQDDAEANVEGFMEGLGPFVVAAESTPMPMVFMDAKQANKSIIFANDTVRLDYPKDGVICTIDMPAPRGGRDE